MKKTFWHFVLFFLLLSITAAGQESVAFTCIQVNEDGSTTLWFQSPANASNVEQYVFWFSSNGSTFSKIDSIAGGQQGNISYTHINALANLGSRHYFIETVYNDGSYNSETLQSIYLQIDNHDPDFNQADLYWNAVSNPLPGGSSSFYKIYWDYPAGIWNLVDSTEEITYSMPVIVCLDSINFKIEIENINSCSSVSNVRGDWFKNVEEPAIPFIDSISVDANEHIIMGWEPVPNAAAYIIYRWESIWKPIDTVIGVNNTFYTDTTQNACNNSIAYSVATIDTCGSSGPKDENKQRRNMRIDDLDFNVCSASITLNWTKYRFPSPTVYQIWLSENGGVYQKVGEVPASDSIFVHTNVSNGVNYSYFVHTEFSTGSSTTCRKTIVTHEYTEPQFIYLANASVFPSNEIELVVEVDTSVYSCSWEFHRFDPISGIYENFETIKKNQLQGFPLVVVDTDVDPQATYYEYYVKVFDSCGFEKLESNILQTIHLTGEIIDNQSNHLQWSAFEGWDASVEKYYIFRMIGEQEPVFPIDSVDAHTFEYTDDYSSLGNVDGRFVYWVQAVEQNGNVYNYKEKSNSNRLNLFLESKMYFPNAFKPNGYNAVFKPVSRFFSGTAYRFQIYNRWGQLIFETTDPKEGWTGEYNGNTVEQGVYVYHLSYRDVYSKSVVYRGTVTLLH